MIVPYGKDDCRNDATATAEAEVSQLNDVKHVCAYNKGISSLLSIRGLPQMQALLTLDLHMNSISRIENLAGLRCLIELNLSANEIELIQGLESLHSLRILNLSCNKLQRVQGLKHLRKLRQLVLSFNMIASLEGFREMDSAAELEFVDMSYNRIRDVEELFHLAHFRNLKSLNVGVGHENAGEFLSGNEIVRSHSFRTKVAEILPCLTLLDGTSIGFDPVITTAELRRSTEFPLLFDILRNGTTGPKRITARNENVPLISKSIPQNDVTRKSETPLFPWAQLDASHRSEYAETPGERKVMKKRVSRGVQTDAFAERSEVRETSTMTMNVTVNCGVEAVVETSNKGSQCEPALTDEKLSQLHAQIRFLEKTVASHSADVKAAFEENHSLKANLRGAHEQLDQMKTMIGKHQEEADCANSKCVELFAKVNALKQELQRRFDEEAELQRRSRVCCEEREKLKAALSEQKQLLAAAEKTWEESRCNLLNSAAETTRIRKELEEQLTASNLERESLRRLIEEERAKSTEFLRSVKRESRLKKELEYRIDSINDEKSILCLALEEADARRVVAEASREETVSFLSAASVQQQRILHSIVQRVEELKKKNDDLLQSLEMCEFEADILRQMNDQREKQPHFKRMFVDTAVDARHSEQKNVMTEAIPSTLEVALQTSEVHPEQKRQLFDVRSALEDENDTLMRTVRNLKETIAGKDREIEDLENEARQKLDYKKHQLQLAQEELGSTKKRLEHLQESTARSVQDTHQKFREREIAMRAAYDHMCEVVQSLTKELRTSSEAVKERDAAVRAQGEQQLVIVEMRDQIEKLQTEREMFRAILSGNKSAGHTT